MYANYYIYSSTLLGAITVFHLLRSWSKSRHIDKTTALNDLPNIGKPRSQKRIKGTAVVCGGRFVLNKRLFCILSDVIAYSIAGLWAARICADHFEDVVIVEPESWLGSEEGRTPPFNEAGERNSKSHGSRTRVMQYKAAHGLY